MTADLPEPLLVYFATRQQQRAEAVNDFLDSLSNYERGLFHDAAVMGYVRGSMHPHGEDIPLNPAIVADVVNACFAHRDLYPTVNADLEERHVTVEYYVQTQQPDGTWVDSSGRTEVPDAAVTMRDSLRRLIPDAEHRLARRTTSVTVQAEILGDGEA